MKPEGECNFQPSEEVDNLEWLTPKEARERLTYADEKNLISQIYGNNQPPRRNVMTRSLAGWWSRIWCRLFGSPQLNRLANALDEYEVRWKCRMQRAGGPSRNTCEQAVDECLARAKRALQEFDLDSGWQSLHTAQSLEIWSYDDDEVLKARRVVYEEATKLSGWRREAITKLVGSAFYEECDEPDAAQDSQKEVRKYRKKDGGTLRRELYQATLVKNEDFNNLYYKIGVRGRNLKIAFFTLSVIVVGLPFIWGWVLRNALGLQVTTVDWRRIVAIELTGIFGASFSVASSLTKSSVDEKIPQQMLGSVVTWMRPMMGAAAALVAYPLFKAGVLPAIISADPNSTLAAFVVAFVAGFSERFIIGAVGAILPEKK
jgi:hypothetical protein